MIRTYTVKELENLSGLTRRTIGDYVAKGLLSGPSHRGRGACYSQADVDVLRVIPRLRVLMKKEFPSLRALHNFLAQLSARDIHGLARKTNPDAFVLAVRLLRLRLLLCTLLPQVSPDRIDMKLAALSPEQIRAVDTGRIQLGSVIDMSRLLQSDDANGAENAAIAESGPAQRNGHRHSNGHFLGSENPGDRNSEFFGTKPWVNSTWSAGWLQDHVEPEADGALHTLAVADSKQRPTPMPAGESDVANDSIPVKRESHVDRISDIARRLERLERLLATG